VSVLVTPLTAGLQPAVTLKAPLSVVLGSDSAGLAGESTGLQSVDTTTGGTYTVTVSGLAATTGSYTIQLILNGSFEQERNDTLDSAQSIDESFLPLAAPGADRGAVLGDFDIATYNVTSVPFSFTDIGATGASRFSTGSDNVAIFNASLGFTFNFFGTNYTTVSFSTNGLITFGSSSTSGANATLASNPSQPAIAPFWDDLVVNNSAANASMRTQLVGTAPNRQYILQWDKVTFVSGGLSSDPITFQAILNEADDTIQFNYLDLASGSAPGNNGLSATVGVKSADPTNGKFVELDNNALSPFVGSGFSVLFTPATTVDYYAFTLAAGQTASLALAGQTAGNLAFDLRDSVETVLATAQSDATNLTLRIASFTAPEAGTYYVRVEGDLKTAYSLLVTRDAAIDAEPNDSCATAQDITGLQAVVGDLETSAVNAADSGWWNSTGAHSATNKNYLTQESTTTDYHNYFVFDLTDVTETITGAELRLTNSLTGASGTPAYTLFDVSTPLTDLQATGSGETDIFGDLGSGTAYGSASFSTINNASIVVIQWNDAGIAALNAARGGLFAVGGAITSASGAMFGSSGNTADVRQLVLTLAPEDWYAMNISAGAPNIVLSTATPADGNYQFANNLDPHIELYDPAGNLVSAPASVLADGRNESLAYHVAGLAPGIYRIRVTTDGSSPGGEYVLRAAALPNAAPQAADDDADTKEDFATVVDVLANDGDMDGAVDATTVEIGAGPGHGTATIDQITGKITYTPAPNYNGADSFTYRVKDDNGAFSNLATVIVAIASVNDVTGFDVQQGATQRSFIRYLDLVFESADDLDAIMAPGRTQLTRYDLDGTGNPTLISLAGVVSHAPGSQHLAFNFGTQGIGGNRNATSGDGYYVLAVDTDGDGVLETKRAFYRLFGDANGDRIVSDADINQIFAALGAAGSNLNEDINGDGVVNAIDRIYAIRSLGRKLADGLWLDD
jgi:hypothetical protein